jgi:hypothetical protein
MLMVAPKGTTNLRVDSEQLVLRTDLGVMGIVAALLAQAKAMVGPE